MALTLITEQTGKDGLPSRMTEKMHLMTWALRERKRYEEVGHGGF